MAGEINEAAMQVSARADAAAQAHTQPPRVMGFADLGMFYVVTGVSLRWIATAASAGPSSIVIWIAAWFWFYVPLAISVIELSSRYPQQGGLYIWSKRAFGDFSGFMSGWTYWTSNLPYFPAVLYFAASNLLFLRGGHGANLADNKSYFMWFSILALVAITVMNVVGLNVGKWLHNVGSFAGGDSGGHGRVRVADLWVSDFVYGGEFCAQHALEGYGFLGDAYVCVRRLRDRIVHGG